MNDKTFDDGGPAFPHTITESVRGDRHFPYDYGLGGATVWDYYAARAPVSPIGTESGDAIISFTQTPESAAEEAADYADAMIAQRAKRFGWLVNDDA